MQLHIGEILASSYGTLHDVAFQESYSPEEGLFEMTGDLEFEGKLLRDEEGILVIAEELDAPLLLPCTGCETPVPFQLSIGKAFERQFYLELPSEFKEETIHDVFLINAHNHQIDLTEMLRQEIELRIPTNILCPKCSKKSEEQSKIVDKIKEKSQEQHPFQNLKEIIDKNK